MNEIVRNPANLYRFLAWALAVLGFIVFKFVAKVFGGAKYRPMRPEELRVQP
jgi:hypothetical protein